MLAFGKYDEEGCGKHDGWEVGQISTVMPWITDAGRARGRRASLIAFCRAIAYTLRHAPSVSPSIAMIPNLITIARLFLVPFTVAMIGRQQWAAAFFGFVVAGLSDAVDGFIARRFDMRTPLGAYLDPIADKALLVSIYVTLALIGMVPGWLAILVVSRDFMIVSAIVLSWVMDRPIDINPLFLSKLNTACQIVFAALVLGGMAFGIGIGDYVDIAVPVVAVLTLASAVAYLGQWLRHMMA
jgi:cardiolipin synthase